MFEALRSAVVTPIVKRWLRTSETSWRRLAVPSGPPLAQSEGPDPDRVLLFGSGICIGYGVASHDLALAGQIARQVSDLTLRGVSVDVVAGENLTVDTALRSFDTKRLRELDVVVATLGTLDRLFLLRPAIWRERIEFLLDYVSAHAPASLRVLFVAVPEISTIVPMPALLGALADRSARALNRELEAACARRPYAQFVPFRPSQVAGRGGTGRTYEHWATLIAPAVAEALDEHQRVSR
jgi:hypothetical protein